VEKQAPEWKKRKTSTQRYAIWVHKIILPVQKGKKSGREHSFLDDDSEAPATPGSSDMRKAEHILSKGQNTGLNRF